MADIAARSSAIATADRRNGLHKLMQRKSTIAFLMALPLILLIGILVAYPAGYAIWLAMLNKSMTKFVGLGNFDFLMKRATFWDIVFQSCLFAITDDVQPGVFLRFDPQQSGIGFGLSQSIPFKLPLRPEFLGFGQPFGFGQTACDRAGAGFLRKS